MANPRNRFFFHPSRSRARRRPDPCYHSYSPCSFDDCYDCFPSNSSAPFYPARVRPHCSYPLSNGLINPLYEISSPSSQNMYDSYHSPPAVNPYNGSKNHKKTCVKVPVQSAGDREEKNEAAANSQKVKFKCSRRSTSVDVNVAALKIQSAFRGYRIRKFSPVQKLKFMQDLEDQTKDLRRRVEDPSFGALIKTDERERLKINESIMSILLKLDGIEGVNDFLRDSRKAVSRKVVALQDFVDSIIFSANHAQNVAVNHENTNSLETRASEGVPEIDNKPETEVTGCAGSERTPEVGIQNIAKIEEDRLNCFGSTDRVHSMELETETQATVQTTESDMENQITLLNSSETVESKPNHYPSFDDQRNVDVENEQLSKAENHVQGSSPSKANESQQNRLDVDDSCISFADNKEVEPDKHESMECDDVEQKNDDIIQRLQHALQKSEQREEIQPENPGNGEALFFPEILDVGSSEMSAASGVPLEILQNARGTGDLNSKNIKLENENLRKLVAYLSKKNEVQNKLVEHLSSRVSRLKGELEKLQKDEM